MGFFNDEGPRAGSHQKPLGVVHADVWLFLWPYVSPVKHHKIPCTPKRDGSQNPNLCSHQLLYPPCVCLEHPKHSGNSGCSFPGGRRDASPLPGGCRAQPIHPFGSCPHPPTLSQPHLQSWREILLRSTQLMYLQEKALGTSQPDSHGSSNGCF